MALDARRRSLTGTLLWLCILSDIVCLALPTSPEPAGLSLEVREDGVRGYWYETADHVGVGAVAFDPNGKVLYLTAYDPATGHDVVVQVDPRDRRGNGDGASTRGWDSRGPRRVATAPLEPDAGFCGTSGEFVLPGSGSSRSSACATLTHPRVPGHLNATKSGGWYADFRGLALDLSNPSATGVYAAHNMHNGTSTKFRIVRYDRVTGGGAVDAAYSADGILHAIATNGASGRLVYVASTGEGRTRIGMLDQTLKPARGHAGTVASECDLTCGKCANSSDAFKIETATYAAAPDGSDWIVFAGAARSDDTSGNLYPALFRVPGNADAFADAAGYSTGMILDGTNGYRMDAECEGVTDSKQGRSSTFTALAKQGRYGYVGTSGWDKNCNGCEKRSACVFMFDLNFAEGAKPLAAIALKGELHEKDVWAAAVEPRDGLSETGHVYFAVGSRTDKGFGRIVKVQIGGTDTALNCVSGCFKRVATYKESSPFGGIAYVPNLHGIVAFRRTRESTIYEKFTTASVTGLAPKLVQTGTTSIIVQGSGFYVPENVENKMGAIACRLGWGSKGFTIGGWSPATFIDSERIRCHLQHALHPNFYGSIAAEISISFDGHSSVGGNWSTSLWTGDIADLRFVRNATESRRDTHSANVLEYLIQFIPAAHLKNTGSQELYVKLGEPVKMGVRTTSPNDAVSRMTPDGLLMPGIIEVRAFDAGNNWYVSQ